MALDYIWKAYIRLRRRKSMGFNGFNKVEWTDVDAFMRRAVVRLAPWEVSLIEDVDDIFCREMAASSEATKAEAQRAARGSVMSTAKRRHVVRKGG